MNEAYVVYIYVPRHSVPLESQEPNEDAWLGPDLIGLVGSCFLPNMLV